MNLKRTLGLLGVALLLLTQSAFAQTTANLTGTVTSDTQFFLKATNPGGPDTCAAWFQYNMSSTSATAARRLQREV